MPETRLPQRLLFLTSNRHLTARNETFVTCPSLTIGPAGYEKLVNVDFYYSGVPVLLSSFRRGKNLWCSPIEALEPEVCANADWSCIRCSGIVDSAVSSSAAS